MHASSWTRTALVAVAATAASATAEAIISARSDSALLVTPSTNWYGDDGTWSAVSLRVGSPPQWVDVLVNTASSETWIVGPGGCDDSSLCASSRGGLFDPSKSSSWKSEGFYQLGVNSDLGNNGYALYGLDDLSFGSPRVTVPDSIIGSINGTGNASTFQTWMGSFGLGVVPGSFNGSSPLSTISALVEKTGSIGSHSYGFTAGARYQQKGTPNSLVLGGFDANRFVRHETVFSLNPSQQPQVFVSSISVTSSSASNNWTTPVSLLSTVDRVSAVIDSSTPYLWLPQSVCDRFAETLGLSYNDTLDLYTFDGNVSSQHESLVNAQLSFTFSLSNLVTSGPSDIVNITLPYSAFDLELTFPAIPNTEYAAPNSSKLYFPLRPSSDALQYRIGRAFLQEAYMVTDYERNSFSVYQAVHPSDPINNVSIVAILRDDESTFSGSPKDSGKLSTAAIVGIAVGVAVLVALLSFAVFFFCRRRNREKTEASDEDKKPPTLPPRSLLDRVLCRNRQPLLHETNGSSSYPTEVGAGAEHERFELPAPLGPAELDSELGTLDGVTENGVSTQDSANISAYERARRKLERQQIAAVHAQQRAETYTGDKTEADISDVPHYRAPEIPDIESPLVSPVGPGSDSIPSGGQPSPVSPAFAPHPGSTEPPTYRRIDPANVVYAGRLPKHLAPSVVPKMVGRDGRTIRSDSSSEPEASVDSSLGSGFTDIEAARTNDLYTARSDNSGSAVSPISNSNSGSNNTRTREVNLSDEDTILRGTLDPVGNRRRLDGEDLVHVPQPAENRFSFEEERILGNEKSS